MDSKLLEQVHGSEFCKIIFRRWGEPCQMMKWMYEVAMKQKLNRNISLPWREVIYICISHCMTLWEWIEDTQRKLAQCMMWNYIFTPPPPPDQGKNNTTTTTTTTTTKGSRTSKYLIKSSYRTSSLGSTERTQTLSTQSSYTTRKKTSTRLGAEHFIIMYTIH